MDNHSKPNSPVTVSNVRKRANTVASSGSKAPATPRMLKNASSGVSVDEKMTKKAPPILPINTATAYYPAPQELQQQHQHQQLQQQHHQQHPQHQPPSQFHRKSIGDWDFVRTVGAGSMGKVKVAKHRRTQEVCAVKIVPRAAKLYQRAHANDPLPSDNAERQKRLKELEKEIARDKRTIREAALGKLLYHPYICRLYEMIPMTNHYYMLFEYVSGGQMLDFIVSHGSLREHHARKFARSIASSLDYCHRNNVVHRDLKIENIMINKAGDIKIIDFGLSNMYDRNKLLKTYCGSLYFAAPELLSAHPYIGPEVDIWSFGVVLYVLVCGKVPFDDQSVTVLHERIKKGNVEYPDFLSQECVDLLSRMLVVNPQKRASLKEIINHRWMNKNFDAKPQSYVPFRVPLQLPLDTNVLKEIEKLDLGNFEYTSRELNRVLSSPEYAVCAQKWYEKNTKYTNTGVPRSLQDYDDPNFPDPTNGFHPLISIYHLVDEMKKRQLAKEMAHQKVTSPFLHAAVQQQQQAVAQQQQQAVAQQQQQQAVAQQQQQAFAQQQQQQTPARQFDSQRATADAQLTQHTDKESSQIDEPHLDDVLSFPEAAHTSARNQKPADLDVPIIQGVIPEQQLSPKRSKSVSINNTMFGHADVTESKASAGINGLFRKLSGRRSSNNNHASTVANKPASHVMHHASYVPDDNAPPVPDINAYSYDKAAATFAEATEPRLRKSGSLRFVDETTELPKRGGERKARGGHSRAVSASAATYAAANKNNALFDAQSIGSNKTLNADDNSKSGDVTATPSTSGVGKKQGASTARAKTVGHGRSKSIGYKKNAYQEVVPPLPQISNDMYADVHEDDFPEKPVSEAAIVESARNAEPGSMPSIEFPKTLYLKGFFSVQTTSTKPPPVIRQCVISTLEKFGVDYLEVKGGFVCTLSLTKRDSGLTVSNSGHDASVTNLSHNSSHSVSSVSASSKGHRRKFSIGFKKQPPTPKIPSTPVLFSPTSPNPASLDDESSASLESLSGIGASDMILSSRVNQGKKGVSTHRNPIRFEIHIVKIPLLGLYGVQLKKLSGNAWAYKTLADRILSDLNL